MNWQVKLLFTAVVLMIFAGITGKAFKSMIDRSHDYDPALQKAHLLSAALFTLGTAMLMFSLLLLIWTGGCSVQQIEDFIEGK